MVFGGGERDVCSHGSLIATIRRVHVDIYICPSVPFILSKCIPQERDRVRDRSC